MCSRAEAARRVLAGRVRVNGIRVRDPESPADPGRDRIEVDGVLVEAPVRTYVAVNKPRGLVVSASDEHGRDTVYRLLDDKALPWLAPVGRLDKASEGLLLMTNDSAWAARITDPGARVAKTYRVQVRGTPGSDALRRLRAGIEDRGEWLHAEAVNVAGGGDRNTWLEFVLLEGRNRELRRMLAACGLPVLRLVRIAIGGLALGELPKGAWRRLSADEARALGATAMATLPDRAR